MLDIARNKQDANTTAEKTILTTKFLLRTWHGAKLKKNATGSYIKSNQTMKLKLFEDLTCRLRFTYIVGNDFHYNLMLYNGISISTIFRKLNLHIIFFY